MIKKIILVALLLTNYVLKAQITEINTYKYLVVEEKFDFLKKSDQYKTSSLTKFLLKKNGFQVFLENEKLPEEIIKNKCKSLSISVQDESNMLTVKSKIIFKDCYGKIVFSTDVGKSKQKEYQKAYQEAIRKAYNTISEDLQYSNNAKKLNKTVEKVAPIEIENDATVVKLPAQKGKKLVQENLNTTTTLYAQPKLNGFQLINTKPEVVFTILKTNVEKVYIISNRNGILYQNKDNWVAEYYDKGVIIQEFYQIKF
ncbi:hypothetical protein DUT90_05160 [Polaribacter sp. WD7]|uniref:hypothetical protein n=1 Tax=Polaribacter sp. WD7 TaxID=2269061 RepID=UPI000DF1DCBA|nr:hypothetical protein [Polaribacter sp. WD7]RCS27505.1 hypothetical protein DUT90_05160 [Polaribacter sp. WD7]